MHYYVHKITLEPIKHGKYTGSIAHHIYLGGCSVNCIGCLNPADTPVLKMTVNEIVNEMHKNTFGIRQVVITGGEPTEQDLTLLIGRLFRTDYILYLETNGIIETSYDDFEYISITPSKSKIPNANSLRRCGEIRFPIPYEKALNEAYGFRAKVLPFVHPKMVWKIQPWLAEGMSTFEKELYTACVNFVINREGWIIDLPYIRNLLTER